MAPSHYALPLHCLSVGDSILVYWDGDRKWYPAEITGASGDHDCEVLYKDGEREWISLKKVRFILKRDRGKRAKSSAGGGEDEGNIESIRDVLFDIEDRLPLEGVHTKNDEWWKAWHDGILMVVEKDDIQGLMDATLSLSLQMKPNITSTWWAEHSDGWRKRLKNAVTVRDATLIVMDLQNNAINWSDARKLFSGKLGMVVCSTSLRIKKKSIFKEILNSKNSVGKEDNPDLPCLDFATSCSTNAEGCEYLIPAPSPCDEATLRKHTDRFNLKNRGSSKRVKTPQLKRTCFDSNKVKCSVGETDFKEDPLDERSSCDSIMSSTYQGSDRSHCSICQIGVAGNFIVKCKNSGCFSAFHSFCLYPPLQIIEKDWLCLNCKGDLFTSKLAKDGELVAKKIQSIVGHRRVILEPEKNFCQDQFLIKWESLSHHHDSWVPLEWLHAIDCVRLDSYMKKCPIMKGSDSVDQRKPEWFKIDRVIACRRKLKSDTSCEMCNICSTNQDSEEFEFLVKWTGLDYCDATWESSCTEELLAEVGKLVQRHQRAAERTDNYCLSTSSGSVCRTPHDLYDAILYGYQLQGVDWILSNFKAGKNVILADEMGLGKTVQVVSFVNLMKEEKLNANPVLIIAPKSILFQWEEEFGHLARDLNVIIYQGEKQSRRCIQAHEMYSSGEGVLFDALITNYELVILDSSVLKKFKWSAIIIDEAHKIKHLDYKLASCLKLYNSDFRLLLTGTPLQGTLLELFALLHFIDPQQFSYPIAEAESFSSIKTGLGSSNTEMQIAQIHEFLKPRMLRRMKSDVLPGSIPVKPTDQPFTFITPSKHTGFSFSIIHLLSAVRKAMITPWTEDTMEIGSHLKKQKREENKVLHMINGTDPSYSQENINVNTSEQAGQNNLLSLTLQEIVNRVRSNPGDPCILETQEPLQDLVRGVLKIFSSKTAPLGAKGWKALITYEKSDKSWSWVGPVSSSSSEDTIEETAAEAWGIPHLMLVKLVDAFANRLKSSQETLRQVGSLTAPPLAMLANLDEQERFRGLRATRSLNTISPSSEEVRAYFRTEEFLRYSVFDRAFSYTAADGKKSVVAPLRRGSGKPKPKARDLLILKPDRPPHVTIARLVRDAAARLPGSIGTRADVCTLIRDSQYIVEDVSDAQLNQVVGRALDRLHYERDPCVQFHGDRKLWVYLHRDRKEEDFEDHGTSSMKNFIWQR